MENETITAIFKIQFALAQSFYFIFLSFIFGLSLLLAMMESVYVLTGKAIFQKMTQFWGKFFAINIAMGLAVGILMQWQFGTYWNDYAGVLGNIFSLPSTLLGKLAFLIEAILMGLFFFGWQRFTQATHLSITWLMALAANGCALWVIFANTSLFSDPNLQLNFIHTMTASYVIAAMFVIGASGYYLFKKSDIPFAKRSFMISLVFAVVAMFTFLMLGDHIAVFNLSLRSSPCVPVMISLSGFMFLYALLVLKFVKWGPSRLVIKRYHFECA